MDLNHSLFYVYAKKINNYRYYHFSNTFGTTLTKAACMHCGNPSVFKLLSSRYNSFMLDNIYISESKNKDHEEKGKSYFEIILKTNN